MRRTAKYLPVFSIAVKCQVTALEQWMINIAKENVLDLWPAEACLSSLLNLQFEGGYIMLMIIKQTSNMTGCDK